jgi:triphosphoribosyl-dephospho-CoA synthase
MDRRGRIELACILEAVAPKVGNVSRRRDLPGLTFVDLVAAALAAAPVLAQAEAAGVGRTILDAVSATRSVVNTNANLGIILLLAPLCAVPIKDASAVAVRKVLEGLTVEDARQAYAAIRLAEPGGLGNVPEQDVAGEPTKTLREAMRLAADRDLVARQYSDAYADVFDLGVPALDEARRHDATIEQAIVYCQLRWLARFPDSLIVRKWGADAGDYVRQRVERVLERHPLGPAAVAPWNSPELEALDTYLTADGNRRNPGTTADLVAASLFWALETGVLEV